MFNIFNDDDSIIDDQADGEYHSEKCQGIDGKAQHDEGRECTNQRYRYGEQRYERSTPILQENEDDKYDEQKCFHERFHDFGQGSFDELSAVDDGLIFHVRREILG